MQTMRESWTDERMDDLKDQMNGRFEQVDRRFEQVDMRFEQVDRRFEGIETELREMRRLLFQGFIASTTITVTCFVGLAGLMVF